MSTRKLILAALACGLAILVAGGVFLFNLARNRDSLTLPEGRHVGEVVAVGGYRAGVLAVERRPEAIVLRVRVEADGNGLADAAAPWSVSVGGLRDQVDVAGLPQPACKGLGVASGSSAECSVAFAAKSGTAFAEFAAAGAKDRWYLGG